MELAGICPGSLASIVTLMEINGIAQGIISQTYRAIEIFVCAGAIYLFINFIITRTLSRLEHFVTASAPRIERCDQSNVIGWRTLQAFRGSCCL